MPKQEPHEILGVPKDATEAQVRKAYLRLALKKHPDKGGDVDEFRKLQEAYEALRDGGGSEEAKEADSPAASPRAKPTRAPPPKAKPSKRFRCATCGKRFSSHLALRAHSVEHMKDEDDDAARRRAEARARGAAPKKDESDDDEPAPRPRRQRPGRATNGGFEAFDRRRSAEARARGGATKNDDDEVCVRCGARGPGDVCRVCGHGPPPDPAKVERRRKAEAARRREEARTAAAASRDNAAVAAQLQEQEELHAQFNNDHDAAREEAMVLEAVRQSSADEAARRAGFEAEVVEAVRQSSQDDALRRAREENDRVQLDMVIAETQEDAELARALAQSRAAERDRREADELARALRLSRAAERERKEQADLEAALALSLADGGAPEAVEPRRRPGLGFLAELDAAVDGRVARPRASAPRRPESDTAQPLLETRVERPQQSLDAALTSPRAAFLARSNESDAALTPARAAFLQRQQSFGARADFGAWQRQVAMLRDLGFAASVAAAYADARRPVEETVDRMLEDGVDFAEEPVYAGRERSSVAKRIASVGSRVLGAVRRTLSSPSSPAPVVAVPVEEAGDSPEDWVPVVDGARTYWMHAALELCAWSDPRADPDAVLFDLQDVQ